MFPSISTIFAIQAFLIAGSIARPWSEPSKGPFKSTTGFSNPTYSASVGGFAHCISGHISVPVNTTSTKFLFAEPKNQYEVTSTFFDILRSNSSLAADINGGPTVVAETFSIHSKLCYPKNYSLSNGPKTIQFLVHGIGFNQSYWDFAPGYSFIDVAAQAGYPTFSYDRLGTGDSSQPDPIQTVQAHVQVAIYHYLVTLLRSGKLASQKFENIIGVGHSFGSIQTVGILSQYPKDLDAAVLTGFSANASAVPLTFDDFGSTIASSTSSKFKDLPNGYLVIGTEVADQTAFYHYPDFDPAIFQLATTHKQPYTLGEIFTLASEIAPSPTFTGAIDAVLGEFDFAFAQGNALYPTDLAAEVVPALFEKAGKGSRSLIVRGAGHALNLHLGAEEWMRDVMDFVGSNGF